MQVRFLLGPAGSGKTFRCLKEIRKDLSGFPEGPPLVLVAPKQTTYQLERQLLSAPEVKGYTRLHILSFERLAHFAFEQLGQTAPELLDEEGRVMVLRALLARKRKDLKLFRASARLTGFAQQLSIAIGELQRSQLTPESLRELAARFTQSPALSLKLQDLAALMQEYVAWLQSHRLQDRERLMTAAAEALNATPKSKPPRPKQPGPLSLWIDGFAELSDNETGLLAALLPYCERTTITFCLPEMALGNDSWLSAWSVPRKALHHCREKLAAVAGADLSIELLRRDPPGSRFEKSPVLQHLERQWSESKPGEDVPVTSQACPDLRLVLCADMEAEAALAAREILAFVRAGGRYRETAVLVRNLQAYHRTFQRVFSRYGIPFFLDQRQSVAHHPVAELTRSALRTVAKGWQHEDWFAALKTGLIHQREEDLDRLENEALARGWKGKAWQQPLQIREAPRNPEDQERLVRLEAQMERLRTRIVPPFQKLELRLKLAQQKPTGAELVAAIRDFWEQLDVAQQLEQWSTVPQGASNEGIPGSPHETVWTEINRWLENVELAFASDALPLREWLPILESGLANLTVGLIPPALDQVLVGAIDRSRNPDIQLGLVLGMNENVFPALPKSGLLLTERDRVELERQQVIVGASARQQLSRERYLAYLACTRARRRLVLACAARDAEGSVLHPSPYLARIRQIFPGISLEVAPKKPEWRECQHSSELFGPLLRHQVGHFIDQGLAGARPFDQGPEGTRPSLTRGTDCLSPSLAAQLYGNILRTSVSRIEQFAACQFKFFVHSGLRAEERKRFELDAREQGSFQHDVLALFHDQLRKENKRWSDITPEEARTRAAEIATALIASYREGLLQADERTRFMARVMTESLQDFVEVLVRWMREQYEFHPVRVELPFGESESQPPWSLDLGNENKLELYGRIDRVDLFVLPGKQEALCAVVDYKSSPKQLDPVLIAQGLQLQLLAYLNVLRHWPNPERVFGVQRLIPAGVFYVNLSGKRGSEKNRLDALDSAEKGRKLAYRHSGRFDVDVLPHLDSRPGAKEGDQFNYRRSKQGSIQSTCREALSPQRFMALLDSVEENLTRMGRQIYSGAVELNPYRKGSVIACDQCEYKSICRIDPWTHSYRVLARQTQQQSSTGSPRSATQPKEKSSSG